MKVEDPKGKCIDMKEFQTKKCTYSFERRGELVDPHFHTEVYFL